MKAAGADAIVLCANTAHAVADELEQSTQLPLIHIATATARAIAKKGFRKVGLLGTTYTMELPFYADKLRLHGIECIVPKEQSVRDYVQYSLKEELGRGILRTATRMEYLKIIDQLVTEGAEAIVLGCTEIPMLLTETDVAAVPVFDTTRIHANAAVEFACQ